MNARLKQKIINNARKGFEEYEINMDKFPEIIFDEWEDQKSWVTSLEIKFCKQKPDKYGINQGRCLKIDGIYYDEKTGEILQAVMNFD